MNPTSRFHRRQQIRPSFARRNQVVLVDADDLPEFPTPKRKLMRILAEYDLFGEIETDDWVKNFLAAGGARNENIESIETIFVATGAFGLRRVIFYVDARLVVGEEDFMKEEAYMMLQDLVMESDVRVTFLAPLD